MYAFTFRYRGAAHEGCNINYKNSRFIPVVFHNLSGYDAHFIIEEIATSQVLKGRVTVIAENKDRYISFSKHIENSCISFRFMDSFRFLPSSLEKLASYLDHHTITTTVFQRKGYTSNQIELVTKKVYSHTTTSAHSKS